MFTWSTIFNTALFGKISSAAFCSDILAYVAAHEVLQSSADNRAALKALLRGNCVHLQELGHFSF